MNSSPLAAAAALALLGPALAAQLNPVDVPFSVGPLGGSAISVVAHPTTPDEILVLRPTDGLFRSLDSGLTFASTGTGYSGAIRNLTPDPQDADTLYALDGTQVLRSTDFGANWLPLGLQADETLKSVAVPTSGSALLALDAFNVYHSADGGANWTVAHAVVPFAGKVLGGVHFAPSDPMVAYVSYNDGVLRSDDGGQSFVQASSWTGTAKSLTVAPTDANTVIVGASFEGVLRSTDGAANFTLVSPGIQGTFSASNPQWFRWSPDGTTLWASTYTVLATSLDMGTTWSNEMDGIPADTIIPTALELASDGDLYLGAESNSLAGGGGGLFERKLGATSWNHKGFPKEHVRHLAIAGPNGKRILSLDSGIHAADSGDKVEPTAYYGAAAMPTRALAVDPANPDYWIVGTQEPIEGNQHTRIVVLTQDGQSYADTYNGGGLGPVEAIEFSPFDPNVVVAGVRAWGPGAMGVLHSQDKGNSWTEVVGTDGWFTVDIAFDPTTPGRVIQLSADNLFSFSLDGGANWTPQQVGLPGTGEAVFVAYDPFVPSRLYYGDTVGGLWTSDDLINWTALGLQLHDESEILMHPDVPGLMWVSTADGSVQVSADGGQSFESASYLYPGVLATDLALDPATGNLLVGTTAASAWELPNASPFINLGGGTQGSGGFTPRHFGKGGLPRMGNQSFSFAGDQLNGGGFAFLFLGLTSTPVDILGGTFHVGQFLIQFPPVPAPGAGAGNGAFEVPFPLPSAPALVGLPIVTQYGTLDSGSVILGNGLRTRLLP